MTKLSDLSNLSAVRTSLPIETPIETPGATVERSTETRQRILASAAQCFAKYGFERTRVDDIAAGASVSRALIHGYFGSKPKLLRAVQNHVLEEWSSSIARLTDEATGPSEALEAWVRHSLTDTRRRPILRAIFADDALAASPSWEEVTRRTRSEWTERLGQLLRLGIARGDFGKDLDVEATALVLRTLQVGLIGEVMADPPRSELATERKTTAAIGLMLAGIRAPGQRSDSREH